MIKKEKSSLGVSGRGMFNLHCQGNTSSLLTLWVLYFPFFNIYLVCGAELHTPQSVPKGQWVTVEIYALHPSTALRWSCSYWRKQMFDFFFFFPLSMTGLKISFTKFTWVLQCTLKEGLREKESKPQKKSVLSLLFSTMSRMPLCWTPRRTQD